MGRKPKRRLAERALQRLVCPKCSSPISGRENLCGQCNAPLGLLGPYEQVLAVGAAYRTASDSPQKPIVVLGMWIIFGPPLFACSAGILFGIANMPELVKGMRSGSDAVTFLFAAGFVIGLAAISARILYKTTMNYYRLGANSPTPSNDPRLIQVRPKTRR